MSFKTQLGKSDFIVICFEPKAGNEIASILEVVGPHIVHSASKTGVDKTDWCIKNMLKGSFQVLHDSLARRSGYSSIAGSNVLDQCTSGQVLRKIDLYSVKFFIRSSKKCRC